MVECVSFQTIYSLAQSVSQNSDILICEFGCWETLPTQISISNTPTRNRKPQILKMSSALALCHLHILHHTMSITFKHHQTDTWNSHPDGFGPGRKSSFPIPNYTQIHMPPAVNHNILTEQEEGEGLHMYNFLFIEQRLKKGQRMWISAGSE